MVPVCRLTRAHTPASPEIPQCALPRPGKAIQTRCVHPDFLPPACAFHCLIDQWTTDLWVQSKRWEQDSGRKLRAESCRQETPGWGGPEHATRRSCFPGVSAASARCENSQGLSPGSVTWTQGDEDSMTGRLDPESGTAPGVAAGASPHTCWSLHLAPVTEPLFPSRLLCPACF